MSTIPFTFLLILLAINVSFSFGCSSCCSSCQEQCSTIQCVSQCQSNCCQQTSCQQSSCCQSGGCCQQQQSCCASNSCCTGSGSLPSCCDSGDCCEGRTQTEIIDRGGVIRGGGGGSGSRRSDSAISATVSNTNHVNNNNILNMSINVISDVRNNIQSSGGRTIAFDRGDDGTTTTNVTQDGTGTKVIRVPVKVPVRYPVPSPPIHIPVPRPYPVPQISSGCCIVVVPCLSQNCHPYRLRCGGCHGNFGYMPINPCHGGCQKRSSWERYSCSMGGECSTQTVDCSSCNDDFYQSFDEYSNCHGCFSSGDESMY